MSLPSEILFLSTLELITTSTQFTHSKQEPIHCLSNLCRDYIQLLATTAKRHAEHAGRTKGSVWDVGRALEEFGLGGIGELREEVEKEMGQGEDQSRIKELARIGLADILPPSDPPSHLTRLSYHPLTSTELDYLTLNPSPPSSSSSSPEPHSPPPLRTLEPAIRIKSEFEDDFPHVEDDEERTESRWKDPNLIPSYVPSFFPPFPGMEKEDTISPVRRRRERETAREDYGTTSTGGDPWLDLIPYSSSTFDVPPVPLSPHKRRRSLSPQPTSLPSYRNSASLLSPSSHYLPLNARRRQLSSSISISSDMSLSGDTLFGSLSVPLSRSAALVPGFIPETGVPYIHPFTTSLPHTVASPLSSFPTLLVPPPHPRIPSTILSISSTLSTPSSIHLETFNRLTRMGPPGPLGSKGEALPYEYVGQTCVLASNVDWPQRVHNHRLPIKEDSSANAASGIKLKLGTKTQGGGGSPAGSQGWATPREWVGGTPGPWIGTGTPGPSTTMGGVDSPGIIGSGNDYFDSARTTEGAGGEMPPPELGQAQTQGQQRRMSIKLARPLSVSDGETALGEGAGAESREGAVRTGGEDRDGTVGIGEGGVRAGEGAVGTGEDKEMGIEPALGI